MHGWPVRREKILVCANSGLHTPPNPGEEGTTEGGGAWAIIIQSRVSSASEPYIFRRFPLIC
jgi:hypothetical protein